MYSKRSFDEAAEAGGLREAGDGRFRRMGGLKGAGGGILRLDRVGGDISEVIDVIWEGF